MSMPPQFHPHRLLALTGRMTVAESDAQLARLLELLSTTAHLELDLLEVPEIDTAGVSVLIAVQREAEALGKRVSLRGYSPAVGRLLDFCQMLGVLGGPADGHPGRAGRPPAEEPR